MFCNGANINGICYFRFWLQLASVCLSASVNLFSLLFVYYFRLCSIFAPDCVSVSVCVLFPSCLCLCFHFRLCFISVTICAPFSFPFVILLLFAFVFPFVFLTSLLFACPNCFQQYSLLMINFFIFKRVQRQQH